nr:hypothetical protein [Microctonus hyperodae filamentous virus]
MLSINELYSNHTFRQVVHLCNYSGRHETSRLVRHLSSNSLLYDTTVLNNLSFCWDYRCLSFNYNITWELIKKTLDKPWNWDELSRHPNITWEIIVQYDTLPWDWTKVSRNPNITWAIVLDNPQYNWNYDVMISYNPNITWTIIENNSHIKWNKSLFSKNVNITLEILQKNPDVQWNFSWLSSNRSLTLDFLYQYPDADWNYEKLSQHSCIVWDYVRQHLDKPWSFYELSSNGNFTYDIIYGNPQYPWSLKTFQMYNPSLTWEIAREKFKDYYNIIAYNPSVITNVDILKEIHEPTENFKHKYRFITSLPCLTWEYIYYLLYIYVYDDDKAVKLDYGFLLDDHEMPMEKEKFIKRFSTTKSPDELYSYYLFEEYQQPIATTCFAYLYDEWFSLNPALRDSTVLDNLDYRWNFLNLSRNPSITWNLIEKTLKQHQLNSDPELVEHDEFFDRYAFKIWDFDELSKHPNVTWINIISTLNEQYVTWNWKNISKNPNITIDIVLENPLYNWSIETLIGENSNITWNIVESNPQLFSKNVLRHFSKNPNLTLTILQQNSHIDWDFDAISFNQKAFSMDMLYNFPNKNWNYSGLSQQKSLTWEYVRENIEKPWNFTFLSVLPNFTYDILYDNFQYPWDYKQFQLYNPSLTWELAKEKFKLNYGYVACNPHVATSVDVIHEMQITWESIGDLLQFAALPWITWNYMWNFFNHKWPKQMYPMSNAEKNLRFTLSTNPMPELYKIFLEEYKGYYHED